MTEDPIIPIRAIRHHITNLYGIDSIGSHFVIPYDHQDPTLFFYERKEPKREEILFQHAISLGNRQLVVRDDRQQEPVAKVLPFRELMEKNNVDPQYFYVVQYNHYGFEERQQAAKRAVQTTVRTDLPHYLDSEALVTECITGLNMSVLYLIEPEFCIAEYGKEKYA